MTQDAKFEDAEETPLAIKAMDQEDLGILAALAQDAIFPVTEMSWQAGQNRFGILLNRFRWEDMARAKQQGRDFERVQSVLVFDSVLSVATNGVDQADKEQIMSLLTMEFEPSDDCSGTLKLILAGDGEIALNVECVDVTLKDVTRPYIAPSKKSPEHDLT